MATTQMTEDHRCANCRRAGLALELDGFCFACSPAHRSNNRNRILTNEHLLFCHLSRPHPDCRLCRT